MILLSKEITKEDLYDLTDEELESAFEKAEKVLELFKSEGRRRTAERKLNFDGAMAFIKGYK